MRRPPGAHGAYLNGWERHEAATVLEIRRFEASDTVGVLNLILSIQQAEFGLAIAADDQPDLLDVPGFYQCGRGDFWVAETEGRVVGSIALKDIGGDLAALRKMFVTPTFRGAPHCTAKRLLDCLVSSAAERGFKEVYLGTTDRFLAAHRFYEKNGFVPCSKDALPTAFPIMALDTRFYMLPMKAKLP